MKTQIKTVIALAAIALAPLAGAASADPHLVVQSALWGDGPSYGYTQSAAAGLRGPAGPVMDDGAVSVNPHASLQHVFFAEGPSYASRDALGAGLRGAAGPVMEKSVHASTNVFVYRDHFTAD